MEFRDSLKDKIEQMRRELAQMLATVLTLKDEPHVAEETTLHMLQSKYALTQHELLTTDRKIFLNVVHNKMHQSEEAVEGLAAIFAQLGEHKTQYAHRALWLLEDLEEHSSTYSFERASRIAQIRQQL